MRILSRFCSLFSAKNPAISVLSLNFLYREYFFSLMFLISTTWNHGSGLFILFIFFIAELSKFFLKSGDNFLLNIKLFFLYGFIVFLLNLFFELNLLEQLRCRGFRNRFIRLSFFIHFFNDIQNNHFINV